MACELGKAGMRKWGYWWVKDPQYKTRNRGIREVLFIFSSSGPLPRHRYGCNDDHSGPTGRGWYLGSEKPYPMELDLPTWEGE